MMEQRELVLNAPFLHFPIRSGAPAVRVRIWLAQTLIWEFSMELSAGEGAFYCPLDVTPYAGAAIRLTADIGADLGAIAAGGPIEDEPELYPGLYREALRPMFHFSSRRGWLNDPNGLVFHGGLYHLYYQHNPFSVFHRGANIAWGHAVSEDLIHWKEHSNAILPWRADWLIASGSAITDSQGVAGYGKNALIAAFTCLGAAKDSVGEYPSGGQFMAYSPDDGQHFIPFQMQPAIPAARGEPWRDPRLFKDGDAFYIAVYERHNSVDGVSFYRSKDLRQWEIVSWRADLYECPDIFRLRVEGTDVSKWVLYGADGLARVGDFEEGTFVESQIRFPLDYGTCTYAGQTWSDEPLGRRVHIAWVRGMGRALWDQDMGYDGMPFSQCMTIPCDLRLRQGEDGLELSRFPVAEVSALRAQEAAGQALEIQASRSIPLVPGTDMELEIAVDSALMEIWVGEHRITYDAAAREMTFPSGGRRRVRKLSMRILVDVTTVECFFDKTVAATFAMVAREAALRLAGNGRMTLKTWTLRSIWNP